MLLIISSLSFAQEVNDSTYNEIDSLLIELNDTSIVDLSLNQTVLCLEGWEAKIVASELIKSELKDTIIARLRDLDARSQERILERDSVISLQSNIIYQDSLQLAAQDSLLVNANQETALERDEKEKAQQELKKKTFWGKVKTGAIIVLGVVVVVLAAGGG